MASPGRTAADDDAPTHDDVPELFGALGVRLLNVWDQRRIGRIGAALYLVAGASVLQSYVTAADSTAFPAAYLLSGVLIVAFGAALVIHASTASDARITRLYPASTIVLLFGAAVAVPTVLYFVGIQGRGHAGSAVYVLPLILGFYLLTRWLAALLLATIALGHAILLAMSGDIVAPVTQYLFLLAILASAGVLIGGLVDRLDQSVRAEERAIAALARNNETLEARVTQQAQELAAATTTRLEEVRASRARLVEVSDAARRQVERDLHDGAQQRLVTVALRLRTLRDDVQAVSNARQISEELDEISEELRAGLRELRELARGVYPSALAGGLVPAVRTLIERTRSPVNHDLRLSRRLSAAVELTAYFVVAECLANVVRHAEGPARVEIADRGDLVSIVVTDDGPGGADPRGGGLSGLAVRVEAIGGDFTVTSAIGQGTTVTVRLPASPLEEDPGLPSCEGTPAVNTMSG